MSRSDEGLFWLCYPSQAVSPFSLVSDFDSDPNLSNTCPSTTSSSNNEFMSDFRCLMKNKSDGVIILWQMEDQLTLSYYLKLMHHSGCKCKSST